MKRKSDVTRLLEAVGFNPKPRTSKVVTVSFKASESDFRLAAKIAERAVKQAREMGRKWTNLDVQMDIITVHANGCPLNLQKLLSAPDLDFTHDMFGIRKHLDRRNGQLLDCFLPRYAA